MKRSLQPVPLVFFSLLLAAGSCGGPVADPDPEPGITVPLEDPILAIGHGAFITPDGREVVPDRDFILSAQAYYVARLEPAAPPARLQTRELIYRVVSDRVLANAVYIDWLTEVSDVPRLAQIINANHALRWHYYLDILGNPRPEGDRWTKGLEPGVARELEANDVPGVVLLKTDAGGDAYVRECREAGVPIPDAMYSAEWENLDTFDREFISENLEAELWIHRSDSPQGMCLALPRYDESCGSGDACLLGVICLGTQTSKACFLDNPNGTYFERGVEVSMSEFVAGADLVPNGQGVCSDCHAGENPYVVHPEKPAFAAIPPFTLQPVAWHDPLVVPAWPQNPGPTNLLDAVPSTGQCNDCHQLGSAGRFPEVSTDLPGYCGTVLATAMGTSAKSTMPPWGMDRSLFTAHISALQTACTAPPSPGGVEVPVAHSDDTGFISPPLVVDPCYQCATQVAVRGAILDAELELFINGISAGTKQARSPTKEEFDVPALTAGDVITARQTFGGAVSSLSPAVTVRDHTVDFPGGLPAPRIDPELIHECGDILAIRHVPGANLTVFSNGGDPRGRRTSTGYSAIRPDKRPFDVGDSFTAQAELCGEVSPLSGAESAVPPPSTIGAPTLDPGSVFAGQELVTVRNIVYGARVTIGEASFGEIGSFSWPVSWYPDYDIATRMGSPLAAADELIVVQELCEASPEWQTPPALSCDELPAPRIRHPAVGDNFVVVTESVPGARIRVYDGGGDELGDGSGTVILLKRAVTGSDTLTVVQQVGECTSSNGYRISVRNVDSTREQDEG